MKYFKYITVIIFCIFSFNDSNAQDQLPVYDSLYLFSDILQENRKINIWLPPDYQKNNNTFYSVLYMPDGGTQEDFPHIANTLAELISTNKIKPVILVGIENIERRKDLTGISESKKDKKLIPNAGGSEKFRQFINDELFKTIQKKYRVGEERGIIGESLAGLFIVETFLLQPGIFDFYIAVDPSLWWNNHFLVKNAGIYLSKKLSSEKRFWFAGSNAKDIQLYTRQLSKSLSEKNIPNLKWKYTDATNEKHNTIYRATKEEALVWSLGNSQ